ncbi:MAG: hypothetical protein RL660_2055 [Bacteroidota bacterium]|jgi:Tfp pilus assembly protein PilF
MQLRIFLSCLALIACLTANAQSAQDLCKQASAAIDNKKYTEAQTLAEAAIAKDSVCIAAHLIKANALVKIKNAQAKYDYLTSCIGRFPEVPEFYLARGDMLMTAQPKIATKDYTDALYFAKTDSTKLHGYLNRAVARIQFRDFERAEQDLNNAYAIDSNNFGVLMMLGRLYDEVGKGDLVLPIFYRALAKDSNDVALLNNIGFKLQHDNKHQEAIDVFTKIIEKNDKEAYPYSNRAFSLLQLGKKTEAMEGINRSIKLDPTNSWAYKVRALIHIANDDTKKACKDLQTALDKGYTELYGEEVTELIKEHCR